MDRLKRKLAGLVARMSSAHAAPSATHLVGYRLEDIAQSPDRRADIFMILPRIGPGTFLVAAYVHKFEERAS
jgi:hypothetical protein